MVGSVSDLHAAEARYHRDCMCRFFAKRQLPTAQEGQSQTSDYQPDMALKHVITTLSSDQKRVWSSVELCKEYQDHGGTDLTRLQLVEKLCVHFDGDLLLISSPGYANVVVFQCHAAVTLKMFKDNKDDLENNICHVAKQIKKECKDIPLDTTKYRLNIDEQLVQESVSCTVQNLLASISTKLDSTPPALLIGNIITSVVRNKSTDLQIALGMLLRDYKSILGYTYDYGITCSYDEIRRFKKSAAVAAAADPSVHGISSAESGLVQTIVDNFDADIHSPNGKLSTHSLAMILTQPSSPGNDQDAETIVRLAHGDVKLPIDEGEDAGQNKPPMPELPEAFLPDEFNAHQRISNDRAAELDFQFMQDMNTLPIYPEYNGYNTMVCREQGHMLRKKTHIVYLPLIDKAPADPATITSALLKAHVMWENQALFSNVYLRLGGMHLLMSYVGSIGSLMAGWIRNDRNTE